MSFERSGVQSPENGIGSSFREGPVGREGGAYARMAELVPCAVGVQVPRGDYTEVPPESLLRKAAPADRPDPARPVPTAGDRVGCGAQVKLTPLAQVKLTPSLGGDDGQKGAGSGPTAEAAGGPSHA